MTGDRVRLVTRIYRSSRLVRAGWRLVMTVWAAYWRVRGHWCGAYRRWVDRWIRRTPNEVVKSNTKEAFDYFFSHDEFVETDYLRESRLAFYDNVADRCLPLLETGDEEEPARRIVDVGCGTGHFLLALEKKLARSNETFGIDFSSVAVARARSTVPGATILEANVYDIPFPDGSFDLVASLETLEHLKKPGAAAAEMRRVCKPGGNLIITVPNGEEDTWGGHRSFWTAETFKQFLAPYGRVEVVELPEDGALLARVAMDSDLDS
jgi:SAM-dependent methyltransferase